MNNLYMLETAACIVLYYLASLNSAGELTVEELKKINTICDKLEPIAPFEGQVKHDAEMCFEILEAYIQAKTA